MPRFKDISGQRFSRLTVLSRVANDPAGTTRWLCKCDCGSTKEIRASSLRCGNTRSCGCLIKERSQESIDKIRKANTKHGHTNNRGLRSPTYVSWGKMKDRCTNPNHVKWRLYGGRGIRICDRWINSFENFLADMGERTEGMSLDRIDNNGNYEPSNCRWATQSQQQGNRSIARFVTAFGKTQTVRQWADESGLPYNLIQQRFRNMHPERALTKPHRPINRAK